MNRHSSKINHFYLQYLYRLPNKYLWTPFISGMVKTKINHKSKRKLNVTISSYLRTKLILLVLKSKCLPCTSNKFSLPCVFTSCPFVFSLCRAKSVL